MARLPNVVENTVKQIVWEAMSERDNMEVWPLWLDDILYGVARLDWYGNRDNQRPLSTTLIIKCLSNLDTITTESVMELLDYKKSQAKLYVKACSLCINFILKSHNKIEVTSMRYPYVSIVSPEHGVARGYNKGY